MHTPNVFTHAISDSPYSIRLFPGNHMLQEYCIDFVRTRTCEPVSIPTGFELWFASSPVGPPRELWLPTLEVGMFNEHPDDIPSGSEKCVV